MPELNAKEDRQLEPTRDQVEAELARIFSVSPFQDSPQLKAFLGFVVRETIDGRGDDLKGYSIATLALGRPDSFDPQTDPIVRVQAGRVRQALTEFYETQSNSGVSITLERGSYQPRFALLPDVAPDQVSRTKLFPAQKLANQNAREPPAQGRSGRMLPRPTRAVAVALGIFLIGTLATLWMLRGNLGFLQPPPLPYAAFVPSLIVEADTQDTSSEIGVLASRTRDAVARFDDIVVVQDNPDMAAALPGAADSRPGLRLALKINGAVAGQDQLRVRARLIDRADQTVLWSKEYDPVATGPSGDRQRSAIVRAIAVAVAQPYGAIHAHVRGQMKARQIKRDPYDCVLATFDYWHSNDAKSHLEARQCIEARLAVYTNAAPLHAFMTYLHLEEHRQGYNPLVGDALANALQSAKRAVQLAPTSARAHQALLAAHFARNEMELAWRAAGEAMQLNPFDTDILQDIGARHVQSGHYEKGLEILQQSLDLNASPPAWAVTFRALALYMLGRTDQSGPIALTLKGSDYPLAMVALVMGNAQARNLNLASEAMQRLHAVHPKVAADLATYLRKLSFDENTSRQFVSDFERAKAWIASNKN